MTHPPGSYKTMGVPPLEPGVLRVTVDFNIAKGEVVWYIPQDAHPALVVGMLHLAATHAATTAPKKSPLSI